MSQYKVRSLPVGETQMMGCELYWMAEFDRWYPVQLQVVVIEGSGVTALINTAPPADMTKVKEQFPDKLWDHLRQSDDETMAGALARAGLTAADVTHLILTPFELYANGCMDMFRHAQVCLSKTGWVHFHTSPDHPHHSHARAFPRESLVHLVTDGWDNVRLLEDEDEIAPGLRTWWSGVHHRSSIVVEVDTRVGTVCISDSFFYYENVEDDRLLGLNESMYEALSTNRRVREVARHIVPLYDPKVFDRYPDGIVAG